MKIIASLLLIFSALYGKAQTLDISDMMKLAKTPTAEITELLEERGWYRYLLDTTRNMETKKIEQINGQWGFMPKGDSIVQYWFYYKKKQNKVTKENGYFENIQYSFRSKQLFKRLEDSVASMGWPKVQDQSNDKQKLKTYDQGDYSVLLITHHRGNEDRYDVIVFKKKPVID